MVLNIIKKSCLASLLSFYQFSASILLFFLLFSLYYYLSLYSINKLITILLPAYILAALLAIFLSRLCHLISFLSNFFSKLDIFSSNFDNFYIDIEQIAFCFYITHILLSLLLLSTLRKLLLCYVYFSVCKTGIYRNC